MNKQNVDEIIANSSANDNRDQTSQNLFMLQYIQNHSQSKIDQRVTDDAFDTTIKKQNRLLVQQNKSTFWNYLQDNDQSLNDNNAFIVQQQQPLNKKEKLTAIQKFNQLPELEQYNDFKKQKQLEDNKIVLNTKETCFYQINRNIKLRKAKVKFIKKVKFYQQNKILLKPIKLNILNQFQYQNYDFRKDFNLNSCSVILKHINKNFNDFGKKPRKLNNKGCRCKNSYCLKLYCDCFRVQNFCDEKCKCIGCKNNQDNIQERKKAIQKTLINQRSIYKK